MPNQKAQLEISADSSGVETGVSQAKRSLASLGQAASAAGKEAADGLRDIGTGGDVAAQKVDRATANLIGSIQRTTAAMEAGSKSSADYYRTLANQRGVSADALKPYLDQLDAVQQKQVLASKALAASAPVMDQLGMSAKATAYAMRGIPAQMTDIVVSLQGGQKPLTVLMQQGGQLKDMFGGVGGAARAMGTYIAGLINPFTLAAAALAGIAFAYSEGAKESQAFNKALVMSGNAAGSTTVQLAAMAGSVAQSAKATKAAAADALAQLIETGKVAGSALGPAAEATIRLQRETGVAVAETVKQFAELGKDPVDASVKLNESTHFLTVRLYEQIKALEDQGKTAEAAAAAQKGYADEVIRRTSNLSENLGYAERAWRAVAAAAKDAWDTFTNIGRPVDPVAEITGKIEAAQRKLARLQTLGNGKDNQLAMQSSERELRILEQKQILLEGEAQREKSLAEMAADGARNDELRFRWDKDGLAVADNKIKLQKELLKAQTEGQILVNAGLIKQEDLTKRIALIREKYKEKAPEIKPDAFATDVAKSYVKSIEDLQRAQYEAAASASDLSKAQSVLRASMASPEWKAYSRQQQEQVIYAASLAQAEEDRAAAHKKATAAIKEAASEHEHFIKSLEGAAKSVADHVQSLNDENQAAVLAAQQNISLAQAIEQVAIARLQEKQIGMLGDESAVLAIQKEIDARKELVAAMKIKEQRDEWASVFKSIDQTAHDTFVNVFESGSSAFKKLGQTLKASVLDLLYQMTVKQWIIGIGASVSGNVASAGQTALAGANGVSSLFSGGSALTSIMGGMSTATTTGAFGSGFSAGFANAIGMEGAGSTLAATSAASTAAGVGTASSIGASIGAAVPYVAIALAIYAAIKATQGETRSGADYKMSADGTITQGYTVSGGPIADSQVRSAITATTDSINKRFALLGSSTTIAAFQAGLNTSGESRGGVFAGGTLSNGATFGQTGIGDAYKGTKFDPNFSFSGDAQAMLKNFGIELSQSTIRALQSASDIPKTIQQMLQGVDAGKLGQTEADALVSSIDKVILSVQDFHTAVQGMPFEQLKTLAFDASVGLSEAAGGFDKLGQNLGTYYDKFYSQQEKTAAVVQTVSDTFKTLGLTMPQIDQGAHAAFRALVEGQDLSTEAGRKTYATLLSIAGAFDQIAPAATDAAGSLAGMTDTLKKLQSDGLSLQDQYDQLTMSQADYRAKLIASYSAEEQAAALANYAIQDKIDAYKLEQAAAQKFVDTMSNLGDTTFSLENQLMSLQGLDPEVAKRVRDRELAKLTQGLSAQDAAKVTAQYDYNESLKVQITLQESAKAAAQASAQAQQQAAQQATQAADQLRQAWQSVNDSIFSEVQRIRGLTGGNSLQSLAATQAQFTLTSAQARTGDMNAAKLLPSLSQSLLTLAEANATTLSELRRIQGQTAASLSATGSSIAASQGLALPSFAVGTDFVPGDMTARIHYGERITPAAYNRNDATNADLVAAVGAVQTELAAMRGQLDDMSYQTRRTADATNGNPENTVPVQVVA